MSIYIGSNEITDIKIGSNEINSVWVGGNKVWDRVLETQTVTVGSQTFSSNNVTRYGYVKNTIGSVSDGTFDLVSSPNDILRIIWDTNNGIAFGLDYLHTNSGWTAMRVGGQSFLRTDATFVQTFPNFTFNTGSFSTFWQWNNVTTNPFGTTNGATKVVEFV